MCVVFSIGYVQCDFVYVHHLTSIAAAVNIIFAFNPPCKKDRKVSFFATTPEVEVPRDFDPKIPASGEKLILWIKDPAKARIWRPLALTRTKVERASASLLMEWPL